MTKVIQLLVFVDVVVLALTQLAYGQYRPPGSIQDILGDYGSATSPTGTGAQVACKSQEVSPGRFKVNCEGADSRQISYKNEHILWITGPPGGQQVVDIEIPNYKIEELIKAGFKPGGKSGTEINVLLRKPVQNYEAQVDAFPVGNGVPTVNLQYEKPVNTLVHFPNDKPYSTLVGRIEPPYAPQIDVRNGLSQQRLA